MKKKTFCMNAGFIIWFVYLIADINEFFRR